MTKWFLPVPNPKFAPDEWPGLMVFASTILGEAAGEPMEGKRAVAAVVMNRVRDERWPDRPEDVCLQRLQFSCWNVGSPTLPRMFNPKQFVSEETWSDCLRSALEASWGAADETGGANHYLNPRSLPSVPSWASDDKIVAQIGRHVFYRL